MKKILALAAGAVLAFAPAGAAFADTGATVDGTGAGNAWGNCATSSATGVHNPAPGSVANGNGGHRAGDNCAADPMLVPPVVGSVG